MLPHSSQPSESPAPYREEVESEPQPSDGKASSGDREAGSESSQQLLQQVLSETLVRNRESSEELVEALRRFRQTHSQHSFDATLFTHLAREILRHRLGQRSLQLPGDLFHEIGLALWSNEQSRRRVQRLWQTLGAGL